MILSLTDDYYFNDNMWMIKKKMKQWVENRIPRNFLTSPRFSLKRSPHSPVSEYNVETLKAISRKHHENMK